MTSAPDHRPIICLFGSYSPQPGQPQFDLAYQIGHALAAAGFTVANGGYDGTMLASAKGAKDAGGSTIGVTCAIFSDYRGRPLKPNPYIDREIPHDNLLSRIDAMLRMSAGYVVLAGGTGTLAEFALVWEYLAKGLITPRPIFVLGDFWQPLIDRITAARPRHARHLHPVHTAGQIVAIARHIIPPPPARG